MLCLINIFQSLKFLSAREKAGGGGTESNNQPLAIT